MNKAKLFVAKTKDKIDDRLSMAGLLKQARQGLQEFLNPDLDIEEQIPFKILSGAKGIALLTVVKGALGIGGVAGTGIIITRTNSGWSGPCAIGLAGIQWGFNIGVQKVENIIVLRDDMAVKTFAGKGQLKFGVDASIAAGPKGRDAAVALSVNDKGYAPTASYSMGKGIYIGISLEGQGIAVRNDCNEEYYQQKVEPNKILDGTVKPPIVNEDYIAICNILDEYTKREGNSVVDLFIDDAEPPKDHDQVPNEPPKNEPPKQEQKQN
jgi:lipid-binding SYLF domain-containing protein